MISHTFCPDSWKDIFAEYIARADVGGPLGYPKSDEMDVEGTAPEIRVSHFENGSLFWDSGTNRVRDFLVKFPKGPPIDF